MLQQLMANQKNDTRVLQNEISGVSTNMAKKMENTEKKMADMITLSSNNLRGLIQETARDFQTEIEKVNTKLEISEKKNEDLIKKAIEEVERKFESRFEKLEKKSEQSTSQPEEIVDIPGPPSQGASISFSANLQRSEQRSPIQQQNFP